MSGLKMMDQTLPPSLLKYVEAPEPLVEAGHIINRLATVLSVVEQISSLEHLHEGSQLNTWSAACLAFAADYQAQAQNYIFDPLRGLYEDHQPYVSLWHEPSDPKNKTKHNHLLGQLLIANSACRRLEAEGEHFESSRKAAFTFARSICKKDYSSTLEALPGKACSTEEYLSHLAGLSDTPRTASFAVFIRYALGLRKGITRDTSDNHHKHPAKEPISLSNEPDIDQNPVTSRSIKMPIHNPAKEKEIEKSGLSSQEFTHQKEHSETSYSEEEPMGGRSSTEHLQRAKSSQKQVAMSNQQLQSRWSVLSSFEASCIASGIAYAYRKSKACSDVDLSHQLLELASLLTIMFWYSVPFDEAINAIGHETMPQKPRERVEFVLDSPSFVLIKTARPEYKSQYRKYKCLDIASHVSLNSGVAIEQIIAEHFKRAGKRRKLFNQSIEYYVRLLENFISETNQSYGCRLTMGRIANCVFESIATAPGSDITYAMLITGRTSYLGANPLFYTATNSWMLNSIYQNTCKSIAKSARMELAGGKRRQTSPVKFNPPYQMHGARIRPTCSEVASLQWHLSGKIEDAKSLGPIEVHNAMAIYTSAFINFATGYRAVGDASFHSNEIDYDTGFAVISDKDSVDEYHSRLVWIMDECIKQIQSYQAQLKAILEYASLKLPNVYKALSNELHGSIKDKARSIPGLFLIEGDKIVPLTPSAYESHFPSSYPFPANAHRHFLRSNLLEMGGPSDVVDAFMGHWENGQEPWASFSTLGAIDYRDIIKPMLTKLIVSRCGWNAIDPYE